MTPGILFSTYTFAPVTARGAVVPVLPSDFRNYTAVGYSDDALQWCIRHQ